jgi:hypothetical protein
MASGKQYKNVYTILEKVKKGEIKSYYKENDGLFGKIQFYKKEDLIKPYLHYIDERKLDNIVEGAFSTQEQIKSEYNNFAKTKDFAKIDADKKPDYGKFYTKVRETYKKFPDHIQKDIYKMYYNKIDKLDFETRNDKNQFKYKFLERANNPVGKIMSEGAALKSSIFTKNMMLYYALQLTIMEYIDPDASSKIKNDLGDNPNGQGDQDLKDMFDKGTSKNMLDRLMNDAQQTCKMMDENFDQDIQDRLFDDALRSSGGEEASKISPDYMRKIAGNLANVRLSMTSLKEKIKKLLDKSISFFSVQTIPVYEDLFNSDNIAGLDDFELLHPKLRKIHLEDVLIKNSKSVGKIDIYIDVSGSMNSGCGVRNIEGKFVTKIDFAKSIAAKLKEMDMLNDVYLFDTRVKKSKNDLISISMITGGGGTNLNVTVNHIKNIGINALVITDAEDHCSEYCDKAFFIGVEGAKFNHFNHQTLQEYQSRNQLVIFTGNKIYDVDKYGHAKAK